MATLTVQDIPLGGAAATYGAAAAGGDLFAPRASGPGAAVLLHVKNGHTAAQTVTVDDPVSRDPGSASAFNPDVAVSVPASGERFILLKPIERFVNADGNVSLTYSGVTALTLAVLRLITG